MARKSQPDRAKEKARKQKMLLAGLGVVFVLLLVIQGPKTLKMLSNKPAAPIVGASSSTTTTTPAASATPAVGATAAPAPMAVVPSSALVSAVQPTVDAGQLREFSHFASKDPFASQAPTPSSSSSSKPSTPRTTPATPTTGPPPKIPPAPPVPPPTSAIISLNGELMSVAVNADFPTAGTVYSRIGSLFHLVSLTNTTAKVTIVGGSYANGAPALTLTLGKPVTLQNTADGTRYTLVLEPPGTQLPTSTTSTPTTTTPGSVVPTGP